MDTMICPKCQGEMDEGFRIDRFVAHGGVAPEEWMQGAPQASFWCRTKVDADHLHRIKTFRCRACGFLESYAQE